MSAFPFFGKSRKVPPRSKKGQQTNRQRRVGWRRPTLETLELRAMMTFLTPTSIAVGANPAGIAVGDYNSDGRADMAVVDQSTSNLNLMLSNGDGTFQNSGSYVAGTGAIDAAFGDFNGDGKNDIAVVSTSGNVNVMLGNGVVGTTDYIMWRKSHGATVAAGTQGDADKNGLVDDSDYALLRQNYGRPLGGQALTAPIVNPVGLGSHSINTTDFNNDGKLDIATMNGGTASVLLGNGDGTFQSHRDAAIPGNSTNLVVGDFDRDGHMDMATSNTASNGTITILKGHGDGYFEQASSVYAFSAPVYLGVGDFNHDGYDDFAVANSYAASSMSVIMNHGDGTYEAPHTYGIGETGYEIQVEDFDHDGNDDYAVRGASKYMVHMGNGDGTFLPGVDYAVPAGRFEMGSHGDFDGDGAVDFAFPSTSGVTVMMNANDSVTNLSNAVGFSVSAPNSTTSGSVLPITVTVVDANGNAVPDFQGTVYITSSDAAAHTTVAYRFRSADAGVHSFTGLVRLVTPGDQTVTISSPMLPAAARTVNVTPAISQLQVDAPTTTTAGDTFQVTVTARNSVGNVGTGYTGTIHFSTADTFAGVPADYTFTPEDAGVHTFTVTLKTAGQRWLGVNEVGRAVEGGASIQISSAAVASLSLGGASGAIGVARPVTVVGRDAFGNAATQYSGTVHITSSDANAVLPGDVTLVNGVGTFNITLLTVGTQTITATDLANVDLTGSMLSDATPPVAAQFAVADFPATTAGDSQSFTVTVHDTIGQIATGYTGMVYFSSSDVQAGLPASYTFTAEDAGAHTFSAVLKTAGPQSILVRDSSGVLTGSQMGIMVSPDAFANFRLSVPLATDSKGHMLVTAGEAISLTVTARDIFGNVVSNYIGTVNFSSTDSKAGLPANYMFTAVDAGVHTFNVDLRTTTPNSVVWSIGVADTAYAATLATITNFEVVNATAATFVINVPSHITAGSPFTMKVSVLDAYGNRVKNYFGTIHFSNTLGLTGLPADYAFNSIDVGDHSFEITLSTAGDQMLTVTDPITTTLSASIAITVDTAGSDGSGGSGGGGKKNG